MDSSQPGPSVHGILQARTGVGCHFLLHMNNKPTPKSGPSVLSFWHVASTGGEIFLSHFHDFISDSGMGEMYLILRALRIEDGQGW